VAVSFHYDPLGRLINKTCRRTLAGQPHGREVTTRFVWEEARLFWSHNQPNGTPERLTDAEGKVCWKGQNSAWGKLLHERDAQLPYAQNLCMQGQSLDRDKFVRNTFDACSATLEGPATGKWHVNRTLLYS